MSQQSKVREGAMLQELDQNLWVAEIPHRYLGIHFGARMTVVRLKNGDLFLHSPIALSGKLKSELDQLGKVRQVVAPNLFHHVYLQDYAQAYPEAKIYGPTGLQKKRKDIVFHGELKSQRDADWSTDLEQHSIAGIPKLNETVFYHQESQTLICCDLLLNFLESNHWWTRIYLKLSGIYGKAGVSKVIKAVFQDRKAARQSLDQILSWDFGRIILSHGEIIEAQGKEILHRNYTWL